MHTQQVSSYYPPVPWTFLGPEFSFVAPLHPYANQSSLGGGLHSPVTKCSDLSVGVSSVQRWRNWEPHPPRARETPATWGGLCAVGRQHLWTHAEEPAGRTWIWSPHEDAGQLSKCLGAVLQTTPWRLSPQNQTAQNTRTYKNCLCHGLVGESLCVFSFAQYLLQYSLFLPVLSAETSSCLSVLCRGNSK